MTNYARPFGDLTRVPPQNIEAEQALLGAMLVNNASWHAIGPGLAPEHFTEEIHRRIWDVASTLIREGRVASPITLKTYLGDHDLGGITVSHYLAQLAAEATTIVNAPDYGRMVAELHARRALMAVASELDAQAFDSPVGTPVERLIEWAEGALMQVRAQSLAHAKTTRVEAGIAASKLLADLDRVRSGEAKDEGMRTGLTSLDLDIGGLRGGDLIPLAGRTAMGKSVVATGIAMGVARGGTGVLLFPLEIGEKQATARLLAALAYTPSSGLTYGQIERSEVDDEGRARLDDAAERLAALPLVLDVATSATLPSIAARVRTEKDRMARRGTRLGVVIIDYIAFVNASDRYKGQRVQEVGEITIGLKQLAKLMDVAIVLLTQINRQTENRDDNRPRISDLRESGSLEQDADIVALIYRENYYIERSTAFKNGEPEAVVRANDTRNEVEIIVAKNRRGPVRSHTFFFDAGASLISGIARGGM